MSNYYKDVKTTASIADAYKSMYATPNEDILNEELIDSLIEDVREEETNEWLDYLDEVNSIMSVDKKNMPKAKTELEYNNAFELTVAVVLSDILRQYSM